MQKIGYLSSAALRRMMDGVILQPGAVALGYKRIGANAPFHSLPDYKAR